MKKSKVGAAWAFMARHNGHLALGPVNPAAATDTDREEAAAALAPLYVIVDALSPRARELIAAAIEVAPEHKLFGTARWFEMLCIVASVPGQTGKAVIAAATGGMAPLNIGEPL